MTLPPAGQPGAKTDTRMRTLHRLTTCLTTTVRRLHPLTWLAAAVTSVLLVLIVVPGEPHWNSDLRDVTSWRSRCERLRSETTDRVRLAAIEKGVAEPQASIVYEHGWPRPCVARACAVDTVVNGIYQHHGRTSSTPLLRIPNRDTTRGGPTFHDVSWSNYDNWPVFADGYLIDPGSLLLDAAVASLIVVAIASAVEWRARRGIFRFYLADLLVAITVCGALLAVYAWHANLKRIEATLATPAHPGNRGNHGYVAVAQEYFGPVWLRKLVGNEYLLPFMHHVTHVNVYSIDDADELGSCLTKLPYLESVAPHTQIPVEFVQRLEACPRLTTLVLPEFDKDLGSPDFASHHELFSPRHFSQLGGLRLKKIQLSGNGIDAKIVEQVASLPTIREIVLLGTATTSTEIEAIQKEYPHLRIDTVEFIPF